MCNMFTVIENILHKFIKINIIYELHYMNSQISFKITYFISKSPSESFLQRLKTNNQVSGQPTFPYVCELYLKGKSQLILAFPIKNSVIVSVLYFFHYVIALNYLFLRMEEELLSTAIIRRDYEKNKVITMGFLSFSRFYISRTVK